MRCVAFRRDASTYLVYTCAWTHRDGSQRNALKTHPCEAGLRAHTENVPGNETQSLIPGAHWGNHKRKRSRT